MLGGFENWIFYLSSLIYKSILHLVFFLFITEKCSSDSLSTGAAVALSCAITFLLSVTITAIITFIITYMFVKKTFEGNKRGMSAQEPSSQSCTNPIAIYDTVRPPSHTNKDIKLQQNPAYGTSDQMIMDNNPVYQSYKN